MPLIHTQVRLGEQRSRDYQRRIPVPPAPAPYLRRRNPPRPAAVRIDHHPAQPPRLPLEIRPQPVQTLGPDSRRRTVHRFILVERIRRSPQIITQMNKPRSPRIPVGNPVRRTVLHNEVAHRARTLDPPSLQSITIQPRGLEPILTPIPRAPRPRPPTSQPFQQLRIPRRRPRRPPRPGGERRIALLSTRASISPALHIEQRLMNRAPPNIPDIPPPPEIHIPARRRLGMSRQPPQKRYPLILLPHQHPPQLMPQSQNTQRTYRIREKRMRPVERMNEPQPLVNRRPARRLHRPGHPERQSVEFRLPPIVPDTPLVHQPQKIPVSTHRTESMIMNTRMSQMPSHTLHRPPPPVLQHIPIPRRLEKIQRIPELKPLSPLRPSPSRITPCRREHRSPALRIPSLPQQPRRPQTRLPHPLQTRRRTPDIRCP